MGEGHCVHGIVNEGPCSCPCSSRGRAEVAVVWEDATKFVVSRNKGLRKQRTKDECEGPALPRSKIHGGDAETTEEGLWGVREHGD